MRFLFVIVKYLPVVAGLLMTFHCFCLLNGKDYLVLKEFFSFSWLSALVLTILSCKLKFCWVHRAYIWYDFLLDLCIKAQHYGMFTDNGIDVNSVRLAVLTLGVFIQITLIIKMNGKRCKSNG